MADVAQAGSHTGLKRNFRDNADSTYAEEFSSQLRAWDPTSLAFVKVIVDHGTGALSVLSSGGGGGAVTVADGADVAQGTTTDPSSSSTVIGLLKAIKAAITGSLTTTTSWAAAQHVIVDTAPSTDVTGPLTDTQLRATAVPVSGIVNPTFPATGAVTSPASVTTSVATVLTSNANRFGATVYNESGAICYLKLGTAASLTSYTVQVAIGGYYEVPFNFTGALTGITSSGTAVLRVTELTA